MAIISDGREISLHIRERKNQVESKKEAFSLLFSGLLSRSDIDKKARFIVGHKFVVLILPPFAISQSRSSPQCVPLSARARNWDWGTINSLQTQIALSSLSSSEDSSLSFPPFAAVLITRKTFHPPSFHCFGLIFVGALLTDIIAEVNPRSREEIVGRKKGQ